MHTKMKEVFDKVHAEDELINHTKEFLTEKTDGYRKKRLFAYRKLAAAAVCFMLLLVVGWKGYSAYFTTAYAISVDVNPSIELGINQFDRVVSVEAFNEDGAAVMSSLDINYMNYKEALKWILADKSMGQYLTDDQMVVVTVFGENEDKSNEMLANVTDCTKSYDNVRCSSCNSEEAAAARDAGISFGKYKAFLELQALDPDMTVEDIQGLTMRQIRDMIDDLSDKTDDTLQDEDRGNGSGCGFGGGQGGRGCRNGRAKYRYKGRDK